MKRVRYAHSQCRSDSEGSGRPTRLERAETPPNVGGRGMPTGRMPDGAEYQRAERIKGPDSLIPRSRSLTPRFQPGASRAVPENPGSWRQPPNGKAVLRVLRVLRGPIAVGSRDETMSSRDKTLGLESLAPKPGAPPPATSTRHQPTRPSRNASASAGRLLLALADHCSRHAATKRNSQGEKNKPQR